MIDLLLLGTGGMMPMPSRWLSSFLVRCNGELVLFDCGEGTQIPWQQSGWGFRRLGSICLSHLHADHVAGLPGVLHTIANSGRTQPITVYGPLGTKAVVTALRIIAPVLPYDVDVVELHDRDSFPLAGGLTGTVIHGDHALPCLIYRAEIGRTRRFDPDRAKALGVPLQCWKRLQNGEPVEVRGSVVEPDEVLGPPRTGLAFGYLTDTRPTPFTVSFLDSVDLLVSEGTYASSADQHKAIERKHLTWQEAATIAREARAKALWLTHFSPAVESPEDFAEEATMIFPATSIGYSGLTTTLSFRDE